MNWFGPNRESHAPAKAFQPNDGLTDYQANQIREAGQDQLRQTVDRVVSEQLDKIWYEETGSRLD